MPSSSGSTSQRCTTAWRWQSSPPSRSPSVWGSVNLCRPTSLMPTVRGWRRSENDGDHARMPTHSAHDGSESLRRRRVDPISVPRTGQRQGVKLRSEPCKSTMTLEEASQLLSNWLTQKPVEVAAQKAALEHYGKFFHPDNLGKITQDDFRAFLTFKNNKHWANIQRQPNIYADMERLRNALAALLDETKPIQDRLDKIMDKNGPLYVKGLGRAVLTPILMCVYPDKYAVYNRISEEGLTRLGLNNAKGFCSISTFSLPHLSHFSLEVVGITRGRSEE